MPCLSTRDLQCSGDSLSSESSTTCDAIVCDVGYGVENHTCVQCGVNTYNPDRFDASGGDRGCITCEPGKYQDVRGETSCKSIFCDENEYVFNKESSCLSTRDLQCPW